MVPKSDIFTPDVYGGQQEPKDRFGSESYKFEAPDWQVEKVNE